jgi:hypothetical protein
MGAIAVDREVRFLELTSAERAPATLSEIVQRVGEGEKFVDICKALDQPYGRMREWLAKVPEREAAYYAARRLRADALADETIGIADGEGYPQNKRIRIDTRFRLASFLDKQYYGDAPKIALSNTVVLKLAPEDERVI